MFRSLDWGRLAAEFGVIVIGVLAALAVDDWRQSRDDKATERYILQGILSDLERDRGDIESAVNTAMVRASAADKLLSLIDHPATGIIELTPWTSDPGDLDQKQVFDKSLERYPADSLSVGDAYRMLVATASMQRVNVSSATYTEASASGEMDTVQDTELRAELAQYYYRTTQFGVTPDNRVDANFQDFRDSLASAGLPSGARPADEDILRVLRTDTALAAELINVREFAVSQIILNGIVLNAAIELSDSVEQAIK